MNKNKETNTGAQGASAQNELPERILINENLMYFDGIKVEAEGLILKANKVAEKYEDLSLGSFTQNIFNQILLDGASMIKAEYLKSIIGDSNSPSLKNLLSQDADIIFKELQVLIDDLVKYRMGSPFNHYNMISSSDGFKVASFKDGRFILSDNDIERIKDHHCRNYITRQEQLEAVEHLKTFIDSFNHLTVAINKFNPAIHRLFTDSFANVGRYAMIENGVATLYTENIIEVIGN